MLDVVGPKGKIKVKDDLDIACSEQVDEWGCLYRDEKDVRASLDGKRDQEFQQCKECVLGEKLPADLGDPRPHHLIENQSATRQRLSQGWARESTPTTGRLVHSMEGREKFYLER